MSITATTPSGKPRRPKTHRQKVPAFARYKGTSAWRKDRRKVHAYALHLAQIQATAQA